MTSAQGGSLRKAALMGGALATVLVATPFLSSLNNCCCALVVLGGIFSGWVLQGDSAGTAGVGRCGLAGAFGGVLSGLLGMPLGAAIMRLVYGAAGVEAKVQEAMPQIESMLRQAGTLPPGSADMAREALRASLGASFGAWTVIEALSCAIAFSFFGLMGGLLGGMLFRKKVAAGEPSTGAGLQAQAPAPDPGSPLTPAPPTAPPTDRVAVVMPTLEATTPPTDTGWPADPPPWADEAPDDGPAGEGPVAVEELPQLPPRDSQGGDDVTPDR